LIQNGFLVAEIWCIIARMIYGYPRVSTDEFDLSHWRLGPLQ
jgi:hypothetical protein